MDFVILDFIQTHIRCDVLDKVMPGITKLGFSRLYLYVHYPTDVFAGMLIGIMAGFFGEFIIRKIDERVRIHENKIVGRNI